MALNNLKYKSPSSHYNFRFIFFLFIPESNKSEPLLINKYNFEKLHNIYWRNAY